MVGEYVRSLRRIILGQFDRFDETDGKVPGDPPKTRQRPESVGPAVRVQSPPVSTSIGWFEQTQR
jgi:hypothetical protein